jgi:hypothetical protein
MRIPYKPAIHFSIDLSRRQGLFPFLPFPGRPLPPTSSRFPDHTVVFPSGKMR